MTTTAAPPTPACPDWCTLESDQHELEQDADDTWLWTHEVHFGKQPDTEDSRRHPRPADDRPVVEVHLQEVLNPEGRRTDRDNVDSVIVYVMTPDEVDTAGQLRALAATILEAADFLDAHRLTGYWRHFAGMPFEEFRTNVLPGI